MIRDDGTTEDISYRCCINERNINKNLYDAMRDCIDPQIKLFRNNNIMRCEFCDKTEEIHIDHITMFRDIDNDFADEWFKYHLENAQLRPLCKCCNLTRTKK